VSLTADDDKAIRSPGTLESPDESQRVR
jgi:hypothetical protein